MLNIIFPYRNRSLKHVQNSLNSLANQSNRDFQISFVDYGSDPEVAAQAKNLCESFANIQYKYHPVREQPWNKSRAVNSVIKNLTMGYCFIADVDMIFHSDFVQKAVQLQQEHRAIYFQVGFLNPNEEVTNRNFDEFDNFRKSTSEATGPSMFPVMALKEIRGFDEFYHFWGAEDTDIHVRLRNAGYEVDYYDREILMLHQWHPSYRSKETKKLTEDYQIRGIVQLNHQHLKFAKKNKITQVNPRGWGIVPSEEVMAELQDARISFGLVNEKRQIDDLLLGQLPVMRDGILKVLIEVDPFQNSKIYLAKKLFRKKVPVYYSLKVINDLVLLHIISLYRDRPYYYRVNVSKNQIELAIKL